ncbi:MULTISPECIES: SMP-30/gluconolactonase/LRE family protein [unclassified Pseudovibrio]|uniref:SMP-30/gluconolactonase/LRE family protein n=1 Tax=unclassified Pseudovibrio TaxID=2627060 RepID=UPI0007AE6405|nr:MULTISPECIES: SMP-30/gluconolactonase/LRE family protein [unclassified Pseudovibrio]KZK92348.1 L-arabinolactonase [Pseudovibrio sp. W74]KZL11055.1 L-arabinolactonase [Pseudovibrio sp. Ad14]
MSEPYVFAKTECSLGEGPLWSARHDALFWVDINNHLVLKKGITGPIETWKFDEPVSAFAQIPSSDDFMLSSATGLYRWSPGTHTRNLILPVEDQNPITRSNDARTDRTGGFWISSMGRKAEKGAGSLYRFFKGELAKVAGDITIPNSLCFSPDGDTAYFSDTVTSQIIKWSLNAQTGLPEGPAEIFADISGTGFGPDGSVVDAEGYLWNAQWGGYRVVRYKPDGMVDRIIEIDASQASCPAFGGADYKTLFITTARENLSEEQLAKEPLAGSVFAVPIDTPGLPDPELQM